MATNIVTFKVTGLSELLMNNPLSMDEDDSAKVRTKKIPPEEDARKRLYVNDEGQFYVPTIAFLNSLWLGSAYQKFGKDTARTLIQSSVFTAEDQTILLDKNTSNPIEDYFIDSRTVVIKATKGRILRHRPLIKNWMCLVSFEIDTDFALTPEKLLPLFNKAGRMIGVMDYRPACRGPFGRYEVELYNGHNNKMKRGK